MDSWTVTLERGANKGARTFPPESKARALQRAGSLCNLHGCGYSADNERRTLTVHAGRYYARPDERINP